MPIELLCPGCNQQLRVPDTAAGKNAKCPRCSAILAVPANGTDSPFSAPPQSAPPPPAPPPSSPFSTSPPSVGLDFGPAAPSSGGSFGSPPPKNPFSDGGGATPGNAWQSGPVNPYASPTGIQHEIKPTGPTGHQVVELGPIFNHAMQVWQANLGTVVGATFIAGIMMFLSNMVGNGIQFAVAQAREPILSIGVTIVFTLCNFAWQTFLGIGQVQIALKLARGQQAEIGDLFKGATRLPSALGFMLLCGLVIYLPVLVLGLLGAVVGGAMGGRDAAGIIAVVGILAWMVLLIPAALYFWSAYYLVVDERAKVLESFGTAARISDGNKLTAFLITIVSFGIMMLGFFALCIGVLFAAPLVSLIWVTAYLMMSGQIPVMSNRQPPPQPQQTIRFQ